MPEEYTSSVNVFHFGYDYRFEGEEHQYLVMLKPNLDRGTIDMLFLELPFSKEEIGSDHAYMFLSDKEANSRLKEFFRTEASSLFEKIIFVEINAKEDKYFCFDSFEGFRFAVIRSNDELYLQSNVELEKCHPLFLGFFSAIKFGSRSYGQTLFFDEIFLGVESKVVYVSYDEETHRRFFVGFDIGWTETITEKQKIVPKRAPTFEDKKVDWIDTKEPKDECMIKVGLHQVVLSFAFEGQIDENPEIRIKGTETFDVETKLEEKLAVSKMTLTKFVFRNTDVLYIAVSRFSFESDLVDSYQGVTVLMVVNMESNGKNLWKYELISYELAATE